MIIYVHAKNKKQYAKELSASMVSISNWLTNSCLHLNTSKTVCMKSANKDPDPEVTVAGRTLSIVHEFKYLGIILDIQLTFKSQVKKVVNRIKLNLVNFRHIRSNLTTEASKLYINAMILSHMNYCMTSWTALQSVETVYKRALKTMDNKSN